MEESHTNEFTRDTTPNLFHRTPMGTAYRSGHHAVLGSAKDLYPAPDNRYPAFAAASQDGRLVTDYRPQCSKNIRTGDQFETKKWMIHHAEDLMEEARKRQVIRTGAALPMANTVPPAAAVVHSNPFYSEVQPTHWKGGLGVERADASAPPIFGTFAYQPSVSEMQANRKNIAMTVLQEGGRNSRRGGA